MKFKFPSSGQIIDDAAVVNQTLLGNSLRPLAPVHLRGSRNSAGDLLIEWIRRERIAFSLRDYAGTPLSEESEIFIVEIYNGSTLLRTVRLTASRAFPINWTEVEFPGASGSAAFATDGGVTCTNQAGGDGFPHTQGDWEFSFTVNGDSPEIGMGEVAINPWNMQKTGDQQAYSLIVSGGVTQPGETASTVTVSDGDRLSIIRQGETVRYYKNYHLGLAPFYVSRYAPQARTFKPYFQQVISSAPFKADACTVRIGNNTHYLYPATLQTIDFGSPQSSIKVRVMQESAIVGRGYFAEATL